MDLKSILGDQLYNVFISSTNFMGIYDTVDDKIVDINPAMKSRTGFVYGFEISVVYSSEEKMFVTIDGVPCTLRVVYSNGKGIQLVDMLPAHTKKWSQSSVLLRLTDMASDGIFELYPLVNFQYMSERFWNILGYTQKEFEERANAWTKFANPEDLVGLNSALDKHIESSGVIEFSHKVRYTHKNGSELIILCRASVVEWLPDGRPWYILGTHTDITNLVKKDALDAKTKFISRMSHEIRSPVCTILNECELLGDKTRTKVIKDTCRQLISITDDILSINKMKKDGLALSPICESLEDMISRCAKRHRLAGKKKGIKIRSSFDEGSVTVMVDVGKFNQVIDNLIGNSLKYSNSGNINMDTEYDQETGMCSVRVSDEGLGMDPSFHTSAFEELVQGDDTAVGAGIGLTLCRRLAHLMNGNVTIEKSSPGKGTTMLFVSYLPQCTRDIDERSSSEPSVDELDFKVLIVDDINTNRVILRRRLESMVTMGLRITKIVEAENGKDAVDKFSQHKGDFQLVLMDCHMPILDGFDSTVQIHGLCSALGLEAVPVVAVTASVSTDIYDRCLSVGMKYVVTKPYSELDLMASIQSCIKASAETNI